MQVIYLCMENTCISKVQDTTNLGEVFQRLSEGDLSFNHVELSQVASALGVLRTKRRPECVNS